MTEITIIRHAQTIYNKEQIFMGRIDAPCSEESKKEIIEFRSMSGEHLRQFDVYYSSPLLRAITTAELLFPDATIIQDERLIERDVGDWSGKPKKEVQERYKSSFINGKMDLYATPQNGEECRVFVYRVLDFLVEIASKYDKKKVVIVTHNGVFRVLKALILQIEFKDVFQKSEPHIIPQSFVVEQDNLLEIKQFAEEQLNKYKSERLTV